MVNTAVTFSEFMRKTTGKEIKELLNGSECAFVGEVAYFLGLRGIKLELDIPYRTDILKDYIMRMEDMGVNMGVASSGRGELVYNTRLFFDKNNRRPFDHYAIDKRVDNSWSIDIGKNNIENVYLNYCDGAGYIPLVAYYFVDSYMRGVMPNSLSFTSVIYDNIVYRDVGILLYCDNKFCENIIHFENLERGQLEWLCYLFTRAQRGMTKWENAEKSSWVQENLEVGDIVLLYNTDGSRDCRRAKLLSCWIAKVVGIYNSGITLEYFVSAEMVLTTVERVDRQFGNSTLRPSYEDYRKFDRVTKSFNFEDIGIDCVQYEKYFITLPMADDGSAQVFVLPNDVGHGFDVRAITLDTYDTIYAVLENRGVEYNKDKFVAKYFTSRGVVPFYERYRKYQPTKYENLTRTELLNKYGK